MFLRFFFVNLAGDFACVRHCRRSSVGRAQTLRLEAPVRPRAEALNLEVVIHHQVSRPWQAAVAQWIELRVTI